MSENTEIKKNKGGRCRLAFKIGAIALISLALVALLAVAFLWVFGFIPGDDDTVPEGKEGMLLISDGVANFRIVYTNESAADGKRAADNFAKLLRSHGIEVDDPISDKKASDVTEREIIIGTGARWRGDECNVSYKVIGYEGEHIAIVGERIVIAAGSPSATKALFERFVEDQLGITKDMERLGDVYLDESYSHNVMTEYEITSVSLGGVPLSEFTLVFDLEGMLLSTTEIRSFHHDIFENTGVYLDTGSLSSVDSFENVILVRYTKDAGESGFRAFMDNGDLYIECSYENAFVDAFSRFAVGEIFAKNGDVSLDSDYFYTDNVSIVTYEDFGALGNGVTDDFAAMYNAHVYANKGGQRIVGREGARYYVSATSFTKTIPVMTDVDLAGAEIIVDDRGSAAHKYRQLSLYTVTRDKTETTISSAKLSELFSGDITIGYGAESLVWLEPFLETKSLVRIINSGHKDFIRHGSNQNSGSSRSDIFMVEANGRISSDTPVAFEFDQVTSVVIYRADDTPITLKNFKFNNITCRAVADTGYKCKYSAYWRGVKINRSNVTLENVTHRMIDEPSLHYVEDNSSHVCDTSCSKYGSRRESYPYYGFVSIVNSYNVTVKDSSLTGHTTYYEDKDATASTGGTVPDPVAMGSYDIVINTSSNVTFDNVIQYTETGLGDGKYWGIMVSNGSKNMNFNKCELSRFDAHAGFWNATLTDTVLGHSFNVIGGGTLKVERTTKLVGDAFISLRGDYGATFRGDIILEDCYFPGYKSYNTARGGSLGTATYTDATVIKSGFATTNKGFRTKEELDAAAAEGKNADQGGYWLWSFGYECYMPINVTVDNFRTDAANLYLYNNLPNEIFKFNYDPEVGYTATSVTNVYRLTESVTYKNMDKAIPICKSGSSKYSTLRSIDVTLVNVGDE